MAQDKELTQFLRRGNMGEILESLQKLQLGFLFLKGRFTRGLKNVKINSFFRKSVGSCNN